MRRLRTRAQFQALLAQAPVARSSHFALHRRRPEAGPAAQAAAPSALEPPTLFGPPEAVWLGAMTPKRWARRAVTRNTIRRQIYAVGASLQPPLPAGAYLVRLRAGFAREQFPSASSAALRRAVRAELLQLFAKAGG